MSRHMTRMMGWITVLMLAAAAPALADSHEAHGKGQGKSGKGPSPEHRAKMADAHEKMAACLRSTRPIDECHAEMKKACHESGHGGECSMGHHGHGQGHGKAKSKNGKATTATPGATPSAAPTTSGPTQ